MVFRYSSLNGLRQIVYFHLEPVFWALLMFSCLAAVWILCQDSRRWQLQGSPHLLLVSLAITVPHCLTSWVVKTSTSCVLAISVVVVSCNRVDSVPDTTPGPKKSKSLVNFHWVADIHILMSENIESFAYIGMKNCTNNIRISIYGLPLKRLH